MAFFIAVAIVIASMLPTSNKHLLHMQGALHPWFHLLAFGVLALVMMASVHSTVVRLVLFALMIGLGVGTEFAEHLIDGLPVEITDVVADSIGVIFGSLVATMRDAG